MSNLYIDSVMKNYGHRKLLSDIYLECSQGDIIGLLGRNGAGKSTLLEIIFGSKPADEKFIKVGDQVNKSLFHSSQLINYLPQGSFLPNHLKISKIISQFSDKKHADFIKGNPLIEPLLDKKCPELSGGDKRLLEIHLIVCSQATYILIDEPFNGIAPIHKETIKALIKEQSKTKGFIVTDHDYRNIFDLATRTILLHEGTIKNIQKKEELSRWGYVPVASSV